MFDDIKRVVAQAIAEGDLDMLTGIDYNLVTIHGEIARYLNHDRFASEANKP